MIKRFLQTSHKRSFIFPAWLCGSREDRENYTSRKASPPHLPISSSPHQNNLQTPSLKGVKPFQYILLILLLLLTACGRNMYDQAKYETYEPSNLLSKGASAQPLPENTVPRNVALTDNRYDDPSFYTGLGNEGFVSELPLPLTEDFLRRGQGRFNIYCSPCHNYSGNGKGMIVQKGFPQPASFHEQRLRSAELGYFVNAMANGFGRMYSYSSRIPPEDRWAIAAYIKALQYSQYALPEDAPEDNNTEGDSH